MVEEFVTAAQFTTTALLSLVLSGSVSPCRRYLRLWIAGQWKRLTKRRVQHYSYEFLILYDV
jgi:hypothetical protein